MSILAHSVDNFLNNPSYHSPLTLIKGLRQGLVYGAKIRFAHSLVQAFLFREEPWPERIRFIFRMSYDHAKSLGLFVLFYKILRKLLSSVFRLSKPWRAFICGGIVGYFVFHEKNSVHEQIILYLLSRIILGLVRYARQHRWLPEIKRPVFPYFAAIVWAITMWLFECHRETLQPSLTRSLIYLHENSNRWSSWRNFFLRDQLS